MKTLAPIFVAIGAAIIAITSAVAGARGAFTNKVPFSPYLIAYICAVFAFAVAAILYYSQDEKPNIAPVRYGTYSTSARQINGQWCKSDGTPFTTEEVLKAKHLLGYKGLVVVNDGDPAYEIHVSSGKVGTSMPTFDNVIARLSKSDGEGFFPINITLENGGGLLGGLFDEMRHKKIDALRIVIRYRNAKRNRYRTKCKLERDVTQSEGLTIIDVHHGRDFFGFLRRSLVNPSRYWF